MQNTPNPSEVGTGEIKLHLLDYWRVIRVRLPLIILVFLLVVITAGVATYLTPRQYLSSVTMQVKEDKGLHIFNGSGDDTDRFDPKFSTTQFQIIQHKEILYPVIDSMKLMQKWEMRSKELTYLQLRKMLNVEEVRNTDLIEISVLDKDRQEAADLANTIAVEYQKKRIDEQQSWVARSLVQLDDEVAKQRDKTESLRDEMTRIRQEGGIVDVDPESESDVKSEEDNSVMAVSQQVSEMRVKVSALDAKEKQIEGMTDDQIMRSLKTFEVDDPTISEIFPQYEAAVSQEADLLASGLGPNHPTVQSLRAKKDVYEKQLKDEITSLRRTLASNLQISQKSLDAMEQTLAQAEKDQNAKKTDSIAYQQAKNEYLKAKRILETAESRYQTELMQRTMPQNPATIWEKAEISDFPAKPKVGQNMAIAVAVGLALGVGLAFLIEYLDTSVKTMQDVEAAIGVPVLAVIPRDVAVLKDAPSDCPDAEGYRIMRTNIEFNSKSADAKTITMISGGAGEGKSTTLNNLAFTFAKGGYRTLIVDADLRRPSQHRFFEVSNERGLSDYLTTDIPLDPLVIKTDIENLSFLPSGRLPIDAVGILNSQRMIDLMHQVKSTYDMIFFDSPPILGVSDASVIASAVDMTIVVVQHRRFPRSMLQRVKQGLLNVNANIIGCVLNNTDIRHDEYYEYYTSYYQYYSPESSPSQKKHSPESKVAPVVASKAPEGDY